jgi:hypothetical protein
MKKRLFRIAGIATVAIISCMLSCKKESGLKPTTVKAVDLAKSDSMVMAPGGNLVPSSNVHLIENGYHLAFAQGHVLKLQNKTNKLMEDFGAGSPSLSGPQQKSLSLFSNDSKKSNSQGPSSPSASWMTNAQWDNPSSTNNITSITTSWTVPVTPATNNGQLIYIFNGLAQQAGGNIIQPVLQYGSNTKFGGNYWVISNWYAWEVGTTWYYAYTTPITVTQGTLLTGTINYTGTTGSSYNYTCAFSGYTTNIMAVDYGDTYNAYPGSGTVNIPVVPVATWAYETLEAYHYVGATGYYEVANFSDYPNQEYVAMNTIAIQTNYTATTPTWTSETGTNAVFGEHTNVIGSTGSETDLYFHPDITFVVQSNNASMVTGYALSDGSIVIASGRTVGGSSHLVNTIHANPLPGNTSATLTMNLLYGAAPTSAYMSWGAGSCWGVINIGAGTITFNGVNITKSSPTETINISLYQ